MGLGTKGVRGIRASLAEPEVVLLILRTKDQAMEIESTTFGTITIDGKTHEHDVVIRLSGEIVKRKKKLSKKYYGTSHVVSKDEAKFVFERGCEQLIVGCGQMGNVHLSPEAEAYFANSEEKQPSMYGAQLKLRPGKKIEPIIEPMDEQ